MAQRAQGDAVDHEGTGGVAPAPASECPCLAYLDDGGSEQMIALPSEGSLVVGRRPQADLSLAWDTEVSRLHAELTLRAGEWVLVDNGWSQNGTFVNGMRVEGQRRLRDGDLITVGRTHLTFHDPRSSDPEITLAAGELTAASPLSEQQHGVLLALCTPLLGDGEGLEPASDEAIAHRLDIPVSTVSLELDQLGRAFRLEDLPLAQRRAETALLALRRGIVRRDDAPTEH